MKCITALLLCLSLQLCDVSAFCGLPTKTTVIGARTRTRSSTAHAKACVYRSGSKLAAAPRNDLEEEGEDSPNVMRSQMSQVGKVMTGLFLSVLLSLAPVRYDLASMSFERSGAEAAEGAKIALCLFKKCPTPLAKCILNPKCLANVICINSCNDKPDETGCQIECGNLWENEVVGEFNKCAVSDMTCVPQKQDDGSYPVPAADKLVPKFDTKMFNGRWYITAGQNKLFDCFPCQVHFFTESAPGKFFGRLNWRIEEPDGEFFTRDALQRFVQDPDQPGHLINHDNEYLHYQDDWYILDFEYDDNPDNVPPFSVVYYRGSNDAWIGYGGVTVYTRDAKLPPEIVPRIREAVKKVNFDFDRDFTVTDNSCKQLDENERLILREKFLGNIALQTEQQLQAGAVNARGNAVNSIQAQKIFFENEVGQAERAFKDLLKKTQDFEQEIVKDVEKVEKGLGIIK